MDFDPEGPKAIPLWINGHAFLCAGGEFFDVIAPRSGEAVRRVPLCGADEAAEAVAAARAAQPAWAAMGLPARRQCLSRLAEALDGYASHFARLLREETGCDETVAAAEVAAAVAALNDTRVGETGVIGLVLGAEMPLAGFAASAAPALLAGASLVVKPSPKAPGAVFALCELTARAEWPAGVVNLLQGDAAAVSGLAGAGIDRLVYRGEAALGEKVAALAEAAGVSCDVQAF